MEKHQIELFKAIRKEDIAKARKAYEGGANVNWPLDRWMIGGRPHWGLRVQVKPFGIYLGMSARESWAVPHGEEVSRGDTLIMAALKCQKREAVSFLMGNESGNTATDIARATGQEFLIRGESSSECEEAIPEWEQGLRFQSTGAGGAPGPTGAAPPVGPDGVQYASVIAEPVHVGASAPFEPAIYATAEPVEGGSTSGAHPVVMATTVRPDGRPGARNEQPYNSAGQYGAF